MDSAANPEPLARLLARAYRMMVDDLHARLRRAGWTDVRPTFGVVLLAARSGTTTNELAVLMGVSKQAVSKLLDQMDEAGYVRRTDNAEDGRMRDVSLAARGHRLLRDVERIYGELEQEWADVVGGRGIERMRTDLTRVLLDRSDGALPPIRQA